MKITKQARRDAKSLFVNCRTDGLLNDDKVRQTVTAVIERKPRGYIGILHHFQRLVKLDVARRTAKIESATELAADLQGKVRENLSKKYGGGLNVSFAVNPALIGGLRVQVGSDVFDGSVAARLAALQDSLS